MSKQKQQRHIAARELLAAQRRAEARRNRLLVAGAAFAVIVLAIGIMVAVKLSSPKHTAAAAGTVPAGRSVVGAVTTVPAAVLDRVGKGKGLESTPKKVTGKSLRTAGAKPLVLYIGGEFCPYCAAQRWSLVVALARFGTFSHLGQTASSPTDTDPDTATLSFHGATYTSKYLTFQGVEMYSNKQAGNGYATLDTPTDIQKGLLTTLGHGSFPFIDFADQATLTSVTVDPALLAGKTHQQIADALSDPSSAIAQAEDGSANAFTTIICRLTNNQPGAVCNSAAARAYESAYSA